MWKQCSRGAESIGISVARGNCQLNRMTFRNIFHANYTKLKLNSGKCSLNLVTCWRYRSSFFNISPKPLGRYCQSSPGDLNYWMQWIPMISKYLLFDQLIHFDLNQRIHFKWLSKMSASLRFFATPREIRRDDDCLQNHILVGQPPSKANGSQILGLLIQTIILMDQLNAGTSTTEASLKNFPFSLE